MNTDAVKCFIKRAGRQIQNGSKDHGQKQARSGVNWAGKTRTVHTVTINTAGKH